MPDERPGGGGHRVHTDAIGFDGAAEVYERGRPDYPKEAVETLRRECRMLPGSRVLDLAAGTGKLTRLFVPLGVDIVAVEPLPGMRRAFSQRLPQVRILDGTAEAIPLPDGSVDAVVVAQAFHWFDAEAALREIHRVLRPDGALGLTWNVRDESVAWVAELSALFEPYRSRTPSHRTGAWRTPFEHTTLFAPLRAWSFPYAQRISADGLVDRVLSISFVAALPAEERDAVASRVRALAADGPETVPGGEFDLPYRTDVYVTAPAVSS